MTDLIFHLGLTKTASSFLQNQVFEGKMYTLDRSKGKPVRGEGTEEFAFHTFFRSNSPCVWRNEKSSEYIDYHSEKGNVLISNESMYEGTLLVFCAGGEVDNSLSEPYLIADRLREISNNRWDKGEVKAFFFFRRQADWMASYYSHICTRFNDPSQKDFENRVRKVLDNPYQTGAPGLYYDLLFEELQGAIGNQNVLALPYESLSEERTWKSIRDFTGFDKLGRDIDFENESDNVKRIEENRWRASTNNRASVSNYVSLKVREVLGSSYKWLEPIRKVGRKIRDLESKTSNIEIEMDPKLRNDIMSVFEENNRRMAEIISIDLEKYNYY